MEKLKINNHNLSYELFESKENNKDVIVILHGWRGASSSWTKVGELLNMSFYNIIIPDIPGASKITECNDIYDIDSYVGIIENFIKNLQKKYKYFDWDNLILWGHSNGGAIAIKIANRKKIKISRLILNNSAGIRNDKKRSMKRIILNNLIKPFKILKKIPLLNKEELGVVKLFYRLIGNHDYLETLDNPKLKQTYLNMISADLRKEIKKVDTYTLLIWGEKDTYTPLSDGYFMRENIKNSKLVVLDDEKHGIHLQNPERLVETFLQNI